MHTVTVCYQHLSKIILVSAIIVRDPTPLNLKEEHRERNLEYCDHRAVILYFPMETKCRGCYCSVYITALT